MPVFLVVLTVFQFLMRLFHFQTSPLYLILNPYVVLMPFTLAWLASIVLYRRSVDTNLLAGWLFILAFPLAALPSFLASEDFPFLFIRGLQFFWGPALLVPALLGLFRMIGRTHTSHRTAQSYITMLSVVAASLSLFEVIAVFVFNVPPLAFPWVDPNGQEIYRSVFRPWGITSYPQPNAVLLAMLFWLSYLCRADGKIHKLMLLAALASSFGGTGLITFLVLIPLIARRRAIGLSVGIPLIVAIVTLATVVHERNSVLYRFDLDTIMRYWSFFVTFTYRFLGGFTANELMFGSQTQTNYTVLGITHDWAYLDVFIAYGFVGLVGYLLLYGCTLYLAVPHEAGVGKRAYFMVMMLLMNFHYGTLNYFVGQVLLSSLAALQLHRAFVRAPAPAANFGAARPLVSRP